MKDVDLHDLFALVALNALLQTDEGRKLPTDVLAAEVYAIANFMVWEKEERHAYPA